MDRAHDAFTVVPATGSDVQALCTCGWLSEPHLEAALVQELWRDHAGVVEPRSDALSE